MFLMVVICIRDIQICQLFKQNNFTYKIKIDKQIMKEVKRGLFIVKLYKTYLQRMEKQMKKFQNFIRKYNSEYVFGFGAPAKLTTFSHFFLIFTIDILFDMV